MEWDRARTRENFYLSGPITQRSSQDINSFLGLASAYFILIQGRNRYNRRPARRIYVFVRQLAFVCGGTYDDNFFGSCPPIASRRPG